ncbi:hypothetical protein L211DRAFT_853522 [Terfezia boudieri ATCC MYA-4762]|uniref:Uncharacterized protein n=1 Tax=Terfezia boudieri ATCC MYA-4762 TaxID=1051890 RepID=A0A3N4LEF1_9PEZI|nr:hypothetical protein L211DRAFT_853522 [Terfezia boudieri ATCC MYA-4762]
MASEAMVNTQFIRGHSQVDSWWGEPMAIFEGNRQTNQTKWGESRDISSSTIDIDRPRGTLAAAQSTLIDHATETDSMRHLYRQCSIHPSQSSEYTFLPSCAQLSALTLPAMSRLIIGIDLGTVATGAAFTFANPEWEQVWSYTSTIPVLCLLTSVTLQFTSPVENYSVITLEPPGFNFPVYNEARGELCPYTMKEANIACKAVPSISRESSEQELS